MNIYLFAFGVQIKIYAYSKHITTCIYQHKTGFIS